MVYINSRKYISWHISVLEGSWLKICQNSNNISCVLNLGGEVVDDTRPTPTNIFWKVIAFFVLL